ncbi:Intraflagellar transport protein 56 [Perkinsus olseni]|uniref:Intraflagellar transport protein 56 n=1 Tax=Perkinsus olseni TaxID=32597 RepID=A0A7J6NFU9_PEROL|nr:Intraflagellar transport protein 56 [Perkinsus olseni]
MYPSIHLGASQGNGNNLVVDERLCNMNLPNLVMMDCDDQQQAQTSSSLPGNHLTIRNNASSSTVATGPGFARDSCPSYAAALASLRTKPLDRGISKGQGGGAGPFPPATTNPNRGLGEVNAMLTEACSRLLDAVQNPDTQYRDLCIQQARKALLVGQHVYRNGELGAAGCGSSLQSLAANVILDPSWKLPSSPTDVAVKQQQQQQQQSPTTAVAASAATYDDYTSTASNSLPRFDPTAAPPNLTLPTTADMSDASKMKLQAMNAEDHRYDTLYGTDSFLGSRVGGTPMHGGSNINHKKRQKSYGAPTGVWKNPYGFVSTIYVNKRRVYGPLRKSVEAATRDREALVGVKDIITTVEDMRAFVRDMLKPNDHGGVALSRHATTTTTTDVCMNLPPNLAAAATSTTPRASRPLPTSPRRRRSRSNKKQQVATLFSSSSSSLQYMHPPSDPTHHSDEVFITI